MLSFLSNSGRITAIYVTKEEQNGVINHNSPAPAVGTLGFQSPTGKNKIYIEYSSSICLLLHLLIFLPILFLSLPSKPFLFRNN